MGTGAPVYATTADLIQRIYGAECAVMKNARHRRTCFNYGFKDAPDSFQTAKLYMYLPAAETVKASFAGVELTGKVEAEARMRM